MGRMVLSSGVLGILHSLLTGRIIPLVLALIWLPKSDLYKSEIVYPLEQGYEEVSQWQICQFANTLWRHVAEQRYNITCFSLVTRRSGDGSRFITSVYMMHNWLDCRTGEKCKYIKLYILTWIHLKVGTPDRLHTSEVDRNVKHVRIKMLITRQGNRDKPSNHFVE
jgi:hypothetical protein